MLDKTAYFVGVFGFMQLSMTDVGLLKDGMICKKRSELTMGEADAVAIYNWVGDYLKSYSVTELRKMARETDEKVKKLLNEHQVVNNFLLSIMLLREYIDDYGTKAEQILMLGKIDRLMDVVDGAVSDDDFDSDIKRTTARTANNIYRQFAGKCQLSDDVRNAYFKKVIKNG